MGRGSILFLLDNNMKHNMVYFVGSIFDNRILQYLSFQSGIFTSPNWIILYKSSFNFEFPAHQYGEFADGIIMQAYPQEVFYYIIGATIALMTIIAFIVNRKSILAKISFYWFVFGFFLLGVLGLGSTYNEMALYLSYFSWAQIILIIMLVNKAVKSERFKYIIIFLSSILLFAYNVNTLLIMSNLLGVNYPPLW
jgi:hypothetical protein